MFLLFILRKKSIRLTNKELNYLEEIFNEIIIHFEDLEKVRKEGLPFVHATVCSFFFSSVPFSSQLPRGLCLQCESDFGCIIEKQIQ